MQRPECKSSRKQRTPRVQLSTTTTPTSSSQQTHTQSQTQAHNDTCKAPCRDLSSSPLCTATTTTTCTDTSLAPSWRNTYSRTRPTSLFKKCNIPSPPTSSTMPSQTIPIVVPAESTSPTLIQPPAPDVEPPCEPIALYINITPEQHNNALVAFKRYHIPVKTGSALSQELIKHSIPIIPFDTCVEDVNPHAFEAATREYSTVKAISVILEKHYGLIDLYSASRTQGLIRRVLKKKNASMTYASHRPILVPKDVTRATGAYPFDGNTDHAAYLAVDIYNLENGPLTPENLHALIGDVPCFFVNRKFIGVFSDYFSGAWYRQDDIIYDRSDPEADDWTPHPPCDWMHHDGSIPVTNGSFTWTTLQTICGRSIIQFTTIPNILPHHVDNTPFGIQYIPVYPWWWRFVEPLPFSHLFAPKHTTIPVNTNIMSQAITWQQGRSYNTWSFRSFHDQVKTQVQRQAPNYCSFFPHWAQTGYATTNALWQYAARTQMFSPLHGTTWANNINTQHTLSPPSNYWPTVIKYGALLSGALLVGSAVTRLMSHLRPAKWIPLPRSIDHPVIGAIAEEVIRSAALTILPTPTVSLGLACLDYQANGLLSAAVNLAISFLPTPYRFATHILYNALASNPCYWISYFFRRLGQVASSSMLIMSTERLGPIVFSPLKLRCLNSPHQTLGSPPNQISQHPLNPEICTHLWLDQNLQQYPSKHISLGCQLPCPSTLAPRQIGQLISQSYIASLHALHSNQVSRPNTGPNVMSLSHCYFLIPIPNDTIESLWLTGFTIAQSIACIPTISTVSNVKASHLLTLAQSSPNLMKYCPDHLSPINHELSIMSHTMYRLWQALSSMESHGTLLNSGHLLATSSLTEEYFFQSPGAPNSKDHNSPPGSPKLFRLLIWYTSLWPVMTLLLFTEELPTSATPHPLTNPRAMDPCISSTLYYNEQAWLRASRAFSLITPDAPCMSGKRRKPPSEFLLIALNDPCATPEVQIPVWAIQL